jgi:hypothetical protein
MATDNRQSTTTLTLLIYSSCPARQYVSGAGGVASHWHNQSRYILKLNSTKIKLHTNHTDNCHVPTCKVKVPIPYTDLFYLFNVNTSHQMRSQSSIVRRDVIQCLCFVIWLLNCKMSYTPPLKRYRQTALHFIIKKSDENPE